MKQKDILLIVVVIIVSGVFSFVASKFLFNSPKGRQTPVEVVEKITADFPTPDKKYFNEKSINPTKLIKIGDSSNTKPFNSQQ